MRHFYVIITILILSELFIYSTFAGTWSDDFETPALIPQWKGDRDNFTITDGALSGRNAHPILILPMRFVEVGENWKDYIVQCRINVFTPNLLECTKGALVLRHSNGKGYVFAVHVATETVEVYRFENKEMLISVKVPLVLEKWYQVRAELQGDQMSFFLDGRLMGKITDAKSPSGAVGLGVEDALSVLFDDFSVTGEGIPSGGGGAAVTKNAGKLPAIWSAIKVDYQ